MSVFLFFSAPAQASEGLNTDPHEYVIDKLKNHDIVFIGTRHKQSAILNFISELIPKLSNFGDSHICLEIASDQQDKLDNLIKSGAGLDQIQIAPQIDCPGYRQLLKTLYNPSPDKILTPVAIDLPRSRFDEDISRDEYMAQVIAKLFHENPDDKILVVLGNLHILKKLDWEDQVSASHQSIREYLTDLCPDASIISIAQVIGNDPDECDFTKRFAPIDGAVALDLIEGFSGWRLGILDVIAIKKTEPQRVIDGLIVY